MADQTTIELNFDTVDVFTSVRYKGNPLAIVHVPADKQITQEQKQRIANEFNLSETVILHENAQDPLDRKVDIFIPNKEIPFAGHPTIGTLCHIARNVQSSSPIKITLHIKAGTIDATYDPGTGIASARIPHEVFFHGTLAPGADFPFPVPSPASDTSPPLPYPVVSLCKGMTFTLVELADTTALSACKTGTVRHVERRADAVIRAAAKPTLVGTYFWTLAEVRRGAAGRGVDVIAVNVRMMLDDIPPEDPATGSAACTFAAALSTWRRGAGAKLRGEGEAATHRPACWERLRAGEGDALRDRYEITQGTEMGRESKIRVEVVMAESGSVEQVILSGEAVDVMKGRLKC